MTQLDAAAVLAHLPEDAKVTVTVTLADWLRAREATRGGPAVLTTKQAADTFGYSPERWRRWAESGRVAGAWQDGRGGPWRLQRTACEAHLRSLTKRAARVVPPRSPAEGTPALTAVPSSPGRRNGFPTKSRGGWKHRPEAEAPAPSAPARAPAR